MSTDLTDIFGDEIVISGKNYGVDRQQSGNAGSDGLTDMHLGSRGYAFIVKGVLRVSGETYDAAHAAMVDKIKDDIEPLLWAPADDYTFKNETFESAIWPTINFLTDNDGVMYHYTSGGDMVVNFIAYGRTLI